MFFGILLFTVPKNLTSILKTRLIDEWAHFGQSIVDATIIQWRRHLNACVRVRGQTSSINCDSFEKNCYTNLSLLNKPYFSLLCAN